MKRFLYGTTALVAAGLVAGHVHAAESLKMSITLNMQEWFGVVNHEKDSGQKFNSFGINTDNEINLKAKALLDNGIEAEAFMRLDAYNNNGGPENAPGAVGLEEQWVALGSAVGKVYAGAKDSINKSLHHQPVDYGITYGDVNIWTKPPSPLDPTVTSTTTLLKGPRDRTSFEQFANNAPMVGYISPKLAGFQLGLTYVPNLTVLGTNAHTKSSVNDHWDATLAYSREFQGMSIGFNSGFAHQDGVELTNGDVKAWNTGLKIGYAGFTLGASFLQTQRPGTHLSDGNAWNSGLAYANGPWGVSYTYFQERRRGDHKGGSNNEKFQTHLVSGKYTLGPGVDLKSSVFHGKFNGQDRSADAQNTWGYGLVSGLDVTF